MKEKKKHEGFGELVQTPPSAEAKEKSTENKGHVNIYVCLS